MLLLVEMDIRGAQVKVGKSGTIIKRPVNRLYPLVKAESQINELQETGNDESYKGVNQV